MLKKWIKCHAQFCHKVWLRSWKAKNKSKNEIQSFQAIGSRLVIIPRFNFLVVVVMGLKLTRNLHNMLNYLFYTKHQSHNSKHEPCKTQNDKPHEILPFQGYPSAQDNGVWSGCLGLRFLKVTNKTKQTKQTPFLN